MIPAKVITPKDAVFVVLTVIRYPHIISSVNQSIKLHFLSFEPIRGVNRH